MDITSYLLGKNAGGGGGGSTEKAKPISISFASTSAVVNADVIDVSLVSSFDGMFSDDTQLEELDLSSWHTTSLTSCNGTCDGCNNLKTFKVGSGFDTSKVATMTRMFYGCFNLQDVPKFDFSSISGAGLINMFRNCNSLTDQSVSNILDACTTVTEGFTGTKTLYNMGFRSTSVPASRIQALPNYQKFLDAGWTIGY